MSEMVAIHGYGLEFQISKEEIEKRIMAMDSTMFIHYAKRFIANEYWPCAYKANRTWFKTREEWVLYENKGLIRREGGVKLYWEGERLNCLVEQKGHPIG